MAAGSLATVEPADADVAGRSPWGQWSAEFDVPDMLSATVADDLVVADTTSARLEIIAATCT